MSKYPWFRLYTETVDDEKLRLLAFEDRWHFVALLCCKGSGLLDSGDDDSLLRRKLAVKLGLSVREFEEVSRRLSEVGLIDFDTFQPLAWDDRQFTSDSSTDRVRKHRERVKQSRNVSVTAQETETETEEKQKPSGDCSPDVPIALACDPPADPHDPTPIRRQQGCTFATFVAECQAKGEKPIPEDHPVFRFADDARIPVEFVRLAWLEFRRDFGEGGKSAKKRQAGMRGWRQHFDNAVRKGWYRLWAFDRQGECYLTPAGVALQREADARDAA